MILVLEEPTSTVNLIEQVVTVFEIADFNIPSGIGEDIFTAAGQLIVALAGSSPTTLDEPGADGLVLTSNPSAAKKLEWRAAAAGGGGGSLTNKRGTAVVAGNVVILDTTNNEAFKTTTTDTDPLVIGVASEAISNNAAGNVLRVGKSTVLVQGNVAYGDWLVTSTTDGRAKSAGATKPNRGAIGKALSEYAGGAAGSVTAWISVDVDVLQYVAPSTSGNVLTSNGTAWTSATPPATAHIAASANVHGLGSGVRVLGVVNGTSGSIATGGTFVIPNGGLAYMGRVSGNNAFNFACGAFTSFSDGFNGVTIGFGLQGITVAHNSGGSVLVTNTSGATMTFTWSLFTI